MLFQLPDAPKPSQTSRASAPPAASAPAAYIAPPPGGPIQPQTATMVGAGPPPAPAPGGPPPPGPGLGFDGFAGAGTFREFIDETGHTHIACI